MNGKVQKKWEITAVLLLLALWQAAAVSLNKKILLASPTAVIGRLFTIWKEEEFLASLSFSFLRIASGFFAGLAIGLILAVLAGKFKLMEIFVKPVMMTIKSVPVASFIIIALIWLSSANLSIFISFLMVLPVIYNNVLEGIKSIDPKMQQMADLFHLPWKRRFTYLWLPTIRPYLLAGCNTALGLAWKSGIAAEVIGIPSGSIGERLYEAKVYLNTVDLFAWTVIIVTISILFEKLFMALLKLFYKKLFAGSGK